MTKKMTDEERKAMFARMDLLKNKVTLKKMIKSEDLYPWQKKAVNDWFEMKGNRRALIHAVMASGKTRTAIEIIKGHIKQGDERFLVLVPKRQLAQQWRDELAAYGLGDIEVETFATACKYDYEDVDLMIVDEAHRSTSPVYSQIYDSKAKNVLTMTATPNDDLKELMDRRVLANVDFDEANVADFEVTYHGIDLTDEEYRQYDDMKQKIGRYMRYLEGRAGSPEYAQAKQNMMPLIMKRRTMVHQAANRTPYALDLIEQKLKEGHKVMVFTERVDQANILFNNLKESGYDPVIYHTKNKGDINKYMTCRSKVIVSVGMLSEGFDSPDTDVGIIVSTALTWDKFNQRLGRIIRQKEGKKAELHVMLAKGTTDEFLLGFSKRFKNLSLRHIAHETLRKWQDNMYFQSPKYSLSQQEGTDKWFLWKETHKGEWRVFYDRALDNIRRIAGTGEVSIGNDGIVYKMMGDEVVVVGRIDTNSLLKETELWK